MYTIIATRDDEMTCCKEAKNPDVALFVRDDLSRVTSFMPPMTALFRLVGADDDEGRAKTHMSAIKPMIQPSQ